MKQEHQELYSAIGLIAFAFLLVYIMLSTSGCYTINTHTDMQEQLCSCREGVGRAIQYEDSSIELECKDGTIFTANSANTMAEWARYYECK